MRKRNWTERNVGGIEKVEAFNDFIRSHEKLIEFSNYVSSIKVSQKRYLIKRKNTKRT